MPDANDILIRRSIALSSRGEGVVVGWVEDNFHHFSVTIRHDGARVLDVRAATLRAPWSTCGEAERPLNALIGQPLPHRAALLARSVPIQFQCTHLFELAALTMAHAMRGTDERRYDMIVSVDPTRPDSMTATLWQDGEAVETWGVAAGLIVTPLVAFGQSLTSGFQQWLETFDDATAERLWLLRRAAWLAAGLTAFQPKAVASETGLGPVCYTYQPEQRDRAHATVNSRLDMRDPGITLFTQKDETP